MSFSLVCFSAGSDAELSTCLRMIRRGRRPEPLRAEFPRLAIVYSGHSDLRVKLERAEQFLAGNPSERPDSNLPDIYYQADPATPPRVAFLYPGQGSQALGMLEGLRSALTGFDNNLHRMEEVWTSCGNEPILPVIYGSSSDDVNGSLRDTRLAQPALGLVSTAVRLSLEAAGVFAGLHAGHSYGELPALCGGEFFDERLLFNLSRERGRLLDEAGRLTPGSMLAVMAERQEVERLCRDCDATLEIVNRNSLRQFVVAGRTDGVERLATAAKRVRVPVRKLNTACAFHSALMSPIEGKWREYLEREIGTIPGSELFALSCVTGRAYPRTPKQVRELLSTQIVRPVDWVGVCESLQDMGANVFIEVGPGRTLTDLMAKNLEGRGGGGDSLILPADPGTADASRHVAHLKARLLLRGLPVNWDDLSDPSAFLSEAVAHAATPQRLPAGPVWAGFIEGNQRLLERYFAQQSGLVELAAQRCDGAERVVLVQTALGANQKVMEAMLAANEAAARSIAGGFADASIAVPLLKSQVAPTQSPANGNTSQVEAALKKEISRVTGFPEESLSRDSAFSDLGIDSLSMTDIWGRLLDQMPFLQNYADRVLQLRSLSDVARVFSEEIVREKASPAPPAATLAPETLPSTSSGAATSEILSQLREAIDAARKVDASRIDLAADFERDLHLDVFAREEIFRECLRPYPNFRQAGRELLNARSLRELGELLSRLGRNGSNAVDESAVGRFVLRDEPVTLTPSEFPVHVLLAGPPSSDLGLIESRISATGIRVSPIHRTTSGWAAAGRHASPESIGELQGLVNKTAECADTIVFLADDCFADPTSPTHSFDEPATALFVLSKALWGESTVDSPRRLIVVAREEYGPTAGGARGLARSLSREVPGIHVRTVWFSSPLEDISASLMLDLLFQAKDAGDAFCDDVDEVGGKLIRRSLNRSGRPSSHATQSALPSSSSRILILGGGDGISAEIGVALAREYKCAIAAVGRTPYPDQFPYPEIESGANEAILIKRKLAAEMKDATGETLQRHWRRIVRQRTLWNTRIRIEEDGGRFTYYTADVSQADSLRTALTAVRADGAIHGVIHGAGIIRDNRLQRKQVSEFRSVVRTKAVAAILLPELLKEEPMQFAFLLSSMTSFTGTAGQTDYGAANEILNAAACNWNRRVAYPVKSLLWSVWGEAGMAGGTLKAHMSQLGLPCIATQEGVSHFLDELRDGDKAQSWVLFAPPATLRYSQQAAAPPSMKAA